MWDITELIKVTVQSNQVRWMHWCLEEGFEMPYNKLIRHSLNDPAAILSLDSSLIGFGS